MADAFENETIADAARQYVAAFYANREASVDSWSVALTNLEFARRRLFVACGYEMDETRG